MLLTSIAVFVGVQRPGRLRQALCPCGLAPPRLQTGSGLRRQPLRPGAGVVSNRLQCGLRILDEYQVVTVFGATQDPRQRYVGELRRRTDRDSYAQIFPFG